MADMQEYMLNESSGAAQFICKELCFCTLSGTLPWDDGSSLNLCAWSHHQHLLEQAVLFRILALDSFVLNSVLIAKNRGWGLEQTTFAFRALCVRQVRRIMV